MRVARLPPLLSLIGMLAIGIAANAEIYRWTDAGGKLHSPARRPTSRTALRSSRCSTRFPETLPSAA